jgi:hypothetical protein
MSTPAERWTDGRNSEDLHALVLTPDPLDAGTRRGVVTDEIADVSVLVSPTLSDSRVAFWMSDSDEAIADTPKPGVETVVGLREEGVAVAGTRERRLRQGADAPRRAGPARDVLTGSSRHAVR